MNVNVCGCTKVARTFRFVTNVKKFGKVLLPLFLALAGDFDFRLGSGLSVVLAQH